MIKLTIDTVLKLQSLINKVNNKNVFSAFTYLTWSYYGVEIFYEYDVNNNCIYLFCKCNKKYWRNFINKIYDNKLQKTILNCRYLILSPIVNKQKDFLFLIEKQIDKLFVNSHCYTGIIIDDLTDAQVKKIKNKYNLELIYQNVSNYLYTREQLQFLSGRKMQKRRNHLNFFLKNYFINSNIKKISNIPFNQIINFLKKWNFANDNFVYKTELSFVRDCRNFILKNVLKGVGLFLDKKLIGITLSYTHGDYCEILVEHAEKNKRGSYQYLMSQNLKLNHFNEKIVDRQDDIWSDAIAESKIRYHPIKIIKKNVVFIKNKVKKC